MTTAVLERPAERPSEPVVRRGARRPFIPLSDAPAHSRRLVPAAATTSSAEPSYSGEFERTYGYVVGLFVQGTYDDVKALKADEDELTLELDWLNEADQNAVRVMAGDLFVGHLDRDTAGQLAPELRKGAELIARIIDGPWGGRQSRGGQAELDIQLAGKSQPS